MVFFIGGRPVSANAVQLAGVGALLLLILLYMTSYSSSSSAATNLVTNNNNPSSFNNNNNIRGGISANDLQTLTQAATSAADHAGEVCKDSIKEELERILENYDLVPKKKSSSVIPPTTTTNTDDTEEESDEEEEEEADDDDTNTTPVIPPPSPLPPPVSSPSPSVIAVAPSGQQQHYSPPLAGTTPRYIYGWNPDPSELRIPTSLSKEGPRSRIWQPSTKGTYSNVECEGDDLLHRTCYLWNVCHHQPTNTWNLYSQDNTNCIGPACDGQQLAFGISLRYDWGIFKTKIVHGAPPAMGTPGVRWVEGVGMWQSRHQAPNTAHTITDDVYGVYWVLRRQLVHPAYTGEGAGLDGVGAVSDQYPGGHLTVIWEDEFGEAEHNSLKYMPLFHHVSFGKASQLHNGNMNGEAAQPRAETVCFRSMYVGTPGISLHRNAAYGNHIAREWPRPIDAAMRPIDRKAWSRFITLRSLSAKGVVPASYVPPVRDTFVIVQREHARRILNIAEVESTIRTLLTENNIKLNLQTVQFERLSLADTAELLQRTVMMFGHHGAGLSNTDYLQPGSVLMEVTMNHGVASSGAFRSWAGGVGVHYTNMMCDGPGTLNDAYNVNLFELRAGLDVILQTVVAPVLGIGPGSHDRPI